MDFFEELQWRGLVYQSTHPEHLASWLNTPRSVYCGFDPTADSLHVGHMMGLIMLRRFQKAGHRPLTLIGGATGMIGDPSGKSEERNLLTVDELRQNVVAIRQQMQRFLEFSDEPSGAQLVNNFDWMRQYSYLDFLRDVGKNFPIGVMLGKDSVKSRLESESGLSYTEFSYMLLQAYDFVHLYRTCQCELQMGGSDQWGNITAGIDLGRRMDGVQLYALTWPLLTKTDGSKMGKTEAGAVWLDPQRTSPYQFYQYWYNVEDKDAGKCLRFLTDLAPEEIEGLDESRQQEPHRRESQRRLAENLTALVHGQEGLASAERATKALFGEPIGKQSDAQLMQDFADVPSTTLSRDRLSGEGLPLVDALVEASLAKSKGEARRAIQQGGVYVNNQRVSDIDRRLTRDDLASETVIVLRIGRKRYALLRFE